MNKNIAHNLSHIWQSIGNKEGWGLVDGDGILLLKSPTKIPNLNLAVIEGDVNDPTIIKNYFQGQIFGVLQSKGAPISLGIDPIVRAEVTEMQIEARDIGSIENDDEIRIVSQPDELSIWCETLGIVFSMDDKELIKFCQEIYLLKDCRLFSYYEGNQLVGTGQINVDENNLVYISSIGVLESHRRQGIGHRLMNACLKVGRDLGGDSYALHASESGEFLYAKLGFKDMGKWQFSIFQN